MKTDKKKTQIQIETLQNVLNFADGMTSIDTVRQYIKKSLESKKKSCYGRAA